MIDSVVIKRGEEANRDLEVHEPGNVDRELQELPVGHPVQTVVERVFEIGLELDDALRPAIVAPRLRTVLGRWVFGLHPVVLSHEHERHANDLERFQVEPHVPRNQRRAELFRLDANTDGSHRPARHRERERIDDGVAVEALGPRRQRMKRRRRWQLVVHHPNAVAEAPRNEPGPVELRAYIVVFIVPESLRKSGHCALSDNVDFQVVGQRPCNARRRFVRHDGRYPRETAPSEPDVDATRYRRGVVTDESILIRMPATALHDQGLGGGVRIRGCVGVLRDCEERQREKVGCHYRSGVGIGTNGARC